LERTSGSIFGRDGMDFDAHFGEAGVQSGMDETEGRLERAVDVEMG
jgi:hypothetical protein